MEVKKKIAIYSGEIPSTTFIERLIDGLAIKNEILIFGFQKSSPKYTSKNIKVEGYKNKFDKLYILIKYSFLLFIYDFKNKQKLDTIIRQKKETHSLLKIRYYPVLYHKPDIFHLQWAKGVQEWMWVQAFGIKLIVSLRGAHINYSPITDNILAETYRNCFPKVDGFHAVSKEIAKEAEKYGAEKDKIKVVYSGLDLKKLLYQSTTYDLQPTTIVSIGRNHWKKGYNYALDACKILQEKGFDFNYTVVGIDKKAEELIFQKNDLQLNEKVLFIKQLPFNEVKQQILNADLLLLPSIEEGIANVVLEAMALGTLVLTTNCGGMDEVVIDGQNGFVVPIRDSEAIANKIIEISKLSNSELEIIKNNARKTIENQHNFDKMISGMNERYLI